MSDKPTIECEMCHATILLAELDQHYGQHRRSNSITVTLNPAEAEWLMACLGLVMQLARHWDDRTANDMANRVTVKIMAASMQAQEAAQSS